MEFVVSVDLLLDDGADHVILGVFVARLDQLREVLEHLGRVRSLALLELVVHPRQARGLEPSPATNEVLILQRHAHQATGQTRRQGLRELVHELHASVVHEAVNQFVDEVEDQWLVALQPAGLQRGEADPALQRVRGIVGFVHHAVVLGRDVDEIKAAELRAHPAAREQLRVPQDVAHVGVAGHDVHAGPVGQLVNGRLGA